MEESIIEKCARVFAFAVFALFVSALIAYASSMVILLLGPREHEHYIMLGVFVVVFVFLMSYNFKYLWNRPSKQRPKFRVEEKDYEKDYFKIGDFSLKH